MSTTAPAVIFLALYLAGFGICVGYAAVMDVVYRGMRPPTLFTVVIAVMMLAAPFGHGTTRWVLRVLLLTAIAAGGVTAWMLPHRPPGRRGREGWPW